MVYNEKEKVGSKFDDIAEILPCSIEMVLIDEKVGDCLQFPFCIFLNASESSSIEMVLVDEKVINLCVCLVFWLFVIDIPLFTYIGSS
jgi:hypothetical protein